MLSLTSIFLDNEIYQSNYQKKISVIFSSRKQFYIENTKYNLQLDYTLNWNYFW